MTRDSDERAETEAAAQRAKLDAARDAADMHEQVSTRGLRRNLMRLIRGCRTFETTFIGSAEVHFRGGMQSVGIDWYKRLMDHAPEAWPTMVAEAAEDERR